MSFRGNSQPGQNSGNASGQRPKDSGKVWYLDKDNNLAMARFKTGATDGKVTEIVKSRDLEEGMQVIIGMKQNGNEKNTNTNNQPRGFRPF